MAAAAMRRSATRPKPNPRRSSFAGFVAAGAVAGSLLVSWFIASMRRTLRSGLHEVVNEGEYRRHEKQCGHGGADQSTDHGAAERRVLLASFANTERHRDHTDYHRKRRHDDGAKARESGIDGSLQRVAAVPEALLGKGHHEDAVRGADAHAHDGTHQGRHAEPGLREEEKQH